MNPELKAFLSHLGCITSSSSCPAPSSPARCSRPDRIRTELLIGFLSVHILLFGGVTVYNSYWDKDTGPIGGLRAPPPLAPWTLHRFLAYATCWDWPWRRARLPPRGRGLCGLHVLLLGL